MLKRTVPGCRAARLRRTLPLARYQRTVFQFSVCSVGAPPCPLRMADPRMARTDDAHAAHHSNEVENPIHSSPTPTPACFPRKSCVPLLTPIVSPCCVLCIRRLFLDPSLPCLLCRHRLSVPALALPQSVFYPPPGPAGVFSPLSSPPFPPPSPTSCFTFGSGQQKVALAARPRPAQLLAVHVLPRPMAPFIPFLPHSPLFPCLRTPFPGCAAPN